MWFVFPTLIYFGFFEASSGQKVSVFTVGMTATFSCASQHTPAWNRQLLKGTSRTIAFGEEKRPWFKDSRFVL